MKPIGHAFLWSGFIAAAFTSLCRLEQTGDKWSTIPWLWYAVAVGVGFTGVVILRLADRRDSQDDSKTEIRYSEVTKSLHAVSETIERLCGQSNIKLSEVLRVIDDECAEPLAQFAESRDSIIRRFGLDAYAEVMTEFASAERYINRSWSASADGYVEEVAASLSRANQHLGKAKQILTGLDSQTALNVASP